MYIGRLPAADATDAATMVAKIIAYETTPNSKFSDARCLGEKRPVGRRQPARMAMTMLYEADFAAMNDAAAADLLPPLI